MIQSDAAEFWPLIKAWSEGKTLQLNTNPVWIDIKESSFAYSPDQYRIKPEPREFYIAVSDYGVCGASDARDGKPCYHKDISVIKVREVLDHD
jgi:hypothetical protein